MILLKKLTNGLFVQFCGFNPMPQTGNTLYIKNDNIKLYSTSEELVITDLQHLPNVVSNSPVVCYHLRFQGPRNAYQRQRELLEIYNYDVRALLNHLRDQHLLTQRYHQVLHPNEGVENFTLSYSRLLRIVRVRVAYLSSEQVFTPFARVPYLNVGKAASAVTMSMIHRKVANDELQALPHDLPIGQHVFDNVQLADIPYSFAALELLPLLMENPGWKIQRLSGGLFQLNTTGLTNKQMSIFLQPTPKRLVPKQQGGIRVGKAA